MLRSLISGAMGPADIAVYIVSALAVVFFTMPIHEFAHAFVGVKLGDNTPRWQGRYTLNPFAHIDYFGALCIIFFGFGWAKPVQINHNNLKKPKRDMAIVAAAGPISNLIVSFISLIIINIIMVVFKFSLSTVLGYILMFFSFIAQINVYLAVFNLIPVPPLDGSRILTAFLPYKYYYGIMRYERYIYIALIAVLYLGILDYPLSFLSSWVLSGLSYLAQLPFNMFL